jgi:prolyl 4-hydroxylase
LNFSLLHTHRSYIGAHESDTRTSSNAWVGRDTNEVTKTLYKRAAHLLNVPDELLTNHMNAEEMQVVHYTAQQKYDAHHDWGVSGYPESRYITLLIYLSDMVSEDAGGETSFPKGANGEGFKVRPVKGNAVLFYNLLEDGNGDDLSLHAALPVREGEKWLANFWVWDPKRL